LNFLQKIIQRLLLVLQFALVIIYILFEEIIWEGIAKPIYNHIESLHILKKLEKQISEGNRYLILVTFVVLLLGVEGAGVLAGVFFVKGHFLFGLLLYITKIPIAAFTFWIFKSAKRKLLSFEWFQWLYNKTMNGLAWLKDLDIYKSTMAIISKIKVKLKALIGEIKERYFSKESRFTTELKSFYRYIKNFKNRKRGKKDD